MLLPTPLARRGLCRFARDVKILVGCPSLHLQVNVVGFSFVFLGDLCSANPPYGLFSAMIVVGTKSVHTLRDVNVSGCKPDTLIPDHLIPNS